MSSGGKGNSRAKTSSATTNTTTETTTNNVDNRAITGSGSLYDVSGNNNRITTTDFGAISAGAGIASDVSQAAIDLGSKAITTSANTVGSIAQAGLDNALAFNQRTTQAVTDVANSAFAAVGESNGNVAKVAQNAFDFAGESLATNAQLSGKALDTVSNANANVLDFASGLFDKVTSALSSASQTQLQSLGNVEESAISGNANYVTKVAGYAFLAVAAIFVGTALFKGAN